MRVIWVMMEARVFYVFEFSSYNYINLDLLEGIRDLIVIRVEEEKLYKAIKSIESCGYSMYREDNPIMVCE